ncbi:hypothetical protein BSKO_13358 [Bryopsis sp. KO-2023]|nr:hypothetical protein BSKO_13358 [Bryopsis sp. KO-2023]
MGPQPIDDRSSFVGAKDQHQIRSDDPLDDAWLLDGNVSFSVGVEMLNRMVASKSYGNAMTRLKCDECLMFLNKVVLPVCTPGRKFSLGLCCPAVRASIDEGKCLCEPRVFQGVIKGQLNFMIQIVRLCRPQFSIPWHLPNVVHREECKPSIKASTAGILNPQFLGMSKTELTSRLEQNVPLPTFNDVFNPPESGAYEAGWARVSVRRSDPSVLASEDSDPMEFKADLFYPKSRAGPGGGGGVQKDLVLADGGPFPLIAFSPGFSSKPDFHVRLLHFLASHGYIVIAQRSTHHLGMDLDRSKFLAWKDDIVTMLSSLIEAGNDESSFLHNAIDTTRIGISGHSNGGAMSIPAAVDAIENHGINVKVVVPISPACILLGDECAIPTEYAPRLHGVRVRFIVGTADQTTPPRSAKFFSFLLPNDTDAEVVLLKGVTHCVWEAEPKLWPVTNSGCGKGSVSPMLAVRTLMMQMEEFLRLHLRKPQGY